MVVKSTLNYERYKREVYQIIEQTRGKKRAKKFIEFLSSRYDKFGRTYLDFRLAFDLIDDYYQVKKLGTICYAIVGTKGQGKTTLMKNILYFLYPRFTADKHIVTKFGKMMEVLDSYPTVDARRPIGLDEPPEGFHFSSKQGMAVRDVVGKWRQQKLYFVICATDMSNIPTYIFRDLDVLIFVPFHGTAYVFRNKPDQRSYIVQDIKDYYYKSGKGYGIFFNIAKNPVKPPGYLKINTHAVCPPCIEAGYLESKAADYKASIEYAANLLKEKPKQPFPVRLSERDKIILHMRKMGKTVTEIGRLIGMSHATVVRICQKAAVNVRAGENS